MTGFRRLEVSNTKGPKPNRSATGMLCAAAMESLPFCTVNAVISFRFSTEKFWSCRPTLRFTRRLGAADSRASCGFTALPRVLSSEEATIAASVQNSLL